MAKDYLTDEATGEPYVEDAKVNGGLIFVLARSLLREQLEKKMIVYS